MSNALLHLPGSTLTRLREALDMGFLRAPYDPVALRSNLGGEVLEEALQGLSALAAQGVTDRGVIAWLDAVMAVRDEVPRPSLVWTGPEVAGLHARETRQVFEELIGRAERSLWISTYAYFDGKKAFEVLAARMDEVEELQVSLLLNIRRAEHHASAEDSVAKAAKSLWRHNWPGVRRPSVYYFPESLVEDPTFRAVLHAKAIVRDEEEVFVTSANFTEAALDRNIELGVLLQDAPFARQVLRHYERLIEEDRLSLLPAK